jgi:hypothetical protein
LLTKVLTASAADASASGVVASADAEPTRASRFARASAAAVALVDSAELGSFSRLAMELTSATVAVASAAVSGPAPLLLMSAPMNDACAPALANTCRATTTVMVAGEIDTPPSELRASACTTFTPAGSSTPETEVLLLKSESSVIGAWLSPEAVVKRKEYWSGVFTSVQLVVVKANGVTSSVPFAGKATAVPPIGTAMVATVALAVAFPNASLTDSRKVHTVPGASAPGRSPNVALLSAVPTSVGSLRFSAGAGTTLHRIVKLAAGAADVTTADSVICDAGLTATEPGETATTLMDGATTPGGGSGLALAAALCVTSRLDASTASPALLSVAAIAAGLPCAAFTTLTSEAAVSTVSAFTAKPTLTPAARRRRPGAEPNSYCATKEMETSSTATPRCAAMPAAKAACAASLKVAAV